MPMPIVTETVGASDSWSFAERHRRQPRVALRDGGRPAEGHPQLAGRMLEPGGVHRVHPRDSKREALAGSVTRSGRLTAPLPDVRTVPTIAGDSREAESQERRDCTMRTIDNIGVSSPPARCGSAVTQTDQECTARARRERRSSRARPRNDRRRRRECGRELAASWRSDFACRDLTRGAGQRSPTTSHRSLRPTSW